MRQFVNIGDYLFIFTNLKVLFLSIDCRHGRFFEIKIDQMNQLTPGLVASTQKMILCGCAQLQQLVFHQRQTKGQQWARWCSHSRWCNDRWSSRNLCRHRLPAPTSGSLRRPTNLMVPHPCSLPAPSQASAPLTPKPFQEPLFSQKISMKADDCRAVSLEPIAMQAPIARLLLQLA